MSERLIATVVVLIAFLVGTWTGYFIRARKARDEAKG